MNNRYPTDSTGNQNNNEWSEALRFFPLELRQVLKKVPMDQLATLIEIRLRVNQPLELNFGLKNSLITGDGRLTADFQDALVIGAEDLKKTLNAFTTCSLYAIEEQLAGGYISLPGGHRVGVTGQVFYDGESIKIIRNISSINFRIARSIKGIARPVLPFLWKEGRFLKTLILGAPATGKTTLLREIIREVSSGVPELGIPGIHVGVVDERSEIAGSYQGIPQLEVGPKTDVLDGCSKRDGVYLLLRTMNPHLIATDEIGREGDWPVIEDIINAGAGFIATAHAGSLAEAMLRPGLKKVLEMGVVERIVTLGNRSGIGVIESVKSGINGMELLNSKMARLRG